MQEGEINVLSPLKQIKQSIQPYIQFFLTVG